MIYKNQFTETESIELKKSTSSLKEAIISISAILNKHQKGELYFGIKNDGTIVGQQVSEQTLRSISQAISDNINSKIYNPGEFPAGYEPEDFIKRDIEAIHRNPLIAELLYCSKDIEKWGTGMRRIYKDCFANKVKVEFQKEKGGFSTIFYRRYAERNIEKVGGRVGIKVGIKLTQNQQRIVDIISEKPDANAGALSELVGISQRKIEQNIF